MLGIYLLCVDLCGNRACGVAAVAVLATNPTFACFSQSALSYTASVCAATWGMFFLWRWSQKGGFSSAMLSGVLIGFGGAVRHADVLMGLPLAAMAGWGIATSSGRGRTTAQVAMMAVAWLVGFSPQLMYQWVAFGAPWTSGYSFSNESTAFSLAWLVEHTPMVLHHLLTTGMLPIFVVAMLGLVHLARIDPRRAAFLGLWAVPLALLYGSYYYIRPTFPLVVLRYDLVVFPAWIITAILVSSTLRRSPRTRSILLAILLLTTIPIQVLHTMAAIGGGGDEGPQTSVTLSEEVRALAPEGAALLSAEDLLYFLAYEGGYVLYDLAVFSHEYLRFARQIVSSDEPSPFQRARLAKIIATLGDKDTEARDALQREIVARRIAEGRQVVLLMIDSSTRALRPFQGYFQITLLRELPIEEHKTIDVKPKDAPQRTKTIKFYAIEARPSGA